MLNRTDAEFQTMIMVANDLDSNRVFALLLVQRTEPNEKMKREDIHFHFWVDVTVEHLK